MDSAGNNARGHERRPRRVLAGVAGAGLACALSASLAVAAGATTVVRPADHHHPGSGAGPHRGRDHGAHGRGLAGTVTGIATNGSSFTLSTGQHGLVQITVDVTSTTTFTEPGSTGAVSIANLATGDRVVVTGSMTATNTATATAVWLRAAQGASTASSAVTVRGTVSSVTTSGFTLVTDKQALVQITVTVTSSTTYSSEGDQPRPFFPVGPPTTPPSAVSSIATSSTTSGSTAPLSLLSIATGDRVTVRGTVSAPNTLTATSVGIHSTGGVTVTGTIGSVGSNTFVISRGRSGLVQITVDVGSATTYAQLTGRPWQLEPPDGTTSTPVSSTSSITSAPGSPPPSATFTDLAKGDRVAVRGTVSAPDTISASMVVILPARGHFGAQD